MDFGTIVFTGGGGCCLLDFSFGAPFPCQDPVVSFEAIQACEMNYLLWLLWGHGVWVGRVVLILKMFPGVWWGWCEWGFSWSDSVQAARSRKVLHYEVRNLSKREWVGQSDASKQGEKPVEEVERRR